MELTAENAKPSFCEWFNPNDIGHLHAYHILQQTGMWPIGFVPEHIWIEPGWQTILAFKLANAWIKYKLEVENGC